MTCEICGKQWEVKPSRARQNNAITCSRECLSTLRSRNTSAARRAPGPTTATCATCGTTFERKASQLAKYPTSYCSRECKHAGDVGPQPERQNGVWLPCGTCGTLVRRTPATLKPNVYCSRLCSNRDRETRSKVKPNMRGEKNFRWLGGRSALPYTWGWTPELRAAVRERDGHRCRNCGQADEDLVVHHLDWQKVNHHPNNLVTLCRSCHSSHHAGNLELKLTLLEEDDQPAD